MKKVKTIPQLDLPGTHELTALELNKIRLSEKHTVLTPALLARIAARREGK